jgi:hypothetical protein
MPWPCSVALSASVSAAFMPGCRRSPSINTGLRRKPRCAGISAGSLLHAARSTAHHGSMLNGAGKAGGIHIGALSG